MPSPENHVCTINTGTYAKYRSEVRDHNGKPYTVRFGIKADGKSEEYEYFYAKARWTAGEARSHCKNHSGSFEAATTAAEKIASGWELSEGKKEYLVIPKGQFQHPQYGKLNFDDAYIDELIRNFNDKVLGNTAPFVDQDHDERGAAGWFIRLFKAAEGLIGEIEWTEIGVDLISKKIYRYFSPWMSTYTDPETKKIYKNVFRGGALTNVPFLKMLPEITLSGKKVEVVEIKLNELQEDNAMLDKLKKLFGIEDEKELSEEDALKKIEEMVKASEKVADVEKQLGEKDTEIETLKKAIADTNAEIEKIKSEKMSDGKEKSETDKRLDEVVAENKKLAEKLMLTERDKCIETALSEGRMEPAKRKFYEELYVKAPDITKQAIEQLPVVLSLKEKGNPNEKKTEQQLSDNEKIVADRLGLSEEDMKKYGDEDYGE